ncbi:MAG TPA: coproporphyrinogen dehydrogenase HemZ [Candidatus Borkfalkia excrementavium]|uniref:Coproporphyrinogen dehydrogenase HemZ n=1 Tax=Candidatus Borkfalkia excrementavium TaxID=2838505 RepID=A0A9D1Z8I7_9FIRM|nr:coproporphyrinogen dehydrogenase HemZ [Candidatus Borkfalkia excrementavium]
MVATNTEFLQNELNDVARLFDRAPDIAHNFLYADGNFLNTVIAEGKEYTFRETCACKDEVEFRRYAKRFAKLAVYEVLSGLCGKRMPWGSLTGIRPTKLAYSELAAGRDFRPLFRKFGVSEENISLISDVLCSQEGIYGEKEGDADLYIGIPFCPTKCNYCSFITADIRYTEKFLPDYLSALEEEIYACKGLFKRLKSAYIGGGTPLVLEANQLERVLRAAASLIPEGTEYTVEAGRPDVFTDEKLALLRDYGVTRVCVNPQTFSDATLERIGRKHTAADVCRAFGMAAKYNFQINCDLIAGLTGETVAEFSDSVDRAISLSPDNITVHTLCLKKGAKLKEEESRLNVDGIEKMIALSREKLYAAGYKPYYLYRQKYMAGNCENTGWTKQGAACIYNVDVMEEITDNIACGANAVSKRVWFEENRIERIGSPKDIPTYIAKIRKIIEDKRALFGLG